MLYGKPERFAVEFELDANNGGEWMFGYACYWICGQRIGNYDISTSLRDVLFIWERMTYDAGNRYNGDLMNLDTKSLVDMLTNGLVGSNEESVVTAKAMDEQWLRHNVKPNVDIFDEWFVYLVEGPDSGRVVYKHILSSTFGDCRLNFAEFDLILSQSIQTLNMQYQRVTNSTVAVGL